MPNRLTNSTDKVEIPDRMWYYVLDWKDRNLIRFEFMFDGRALHELYKWEFIGLCGYIFAEDNAYIINQKK